MSDLITQEAIMQLTEGIWSSMLQLTVAARRGDQMPDDNAPSLTACVSITGDWKGALLILVPLPLAARITESMLGMGAGEAAPGDVRDAMGEVANMLGGNLKGMMPGACQLSLPTVMTGTDYHISLPEVKATHGFGFETEGIPFRVTVVEC